MNETLISACTMFLVPATLLFGALGVANSSFLKLLVCLLGGATSGLWFYRVWWWTNLSLIDRRTALGLSGMYAGAWLITLLVLVYSLAFCILFAVFRIRERKWQAAHKKRLDELRGKPPV